MSATFFHNTLLHANDFICMLNGAQPVSHDNDRLLAAVNELIEGFLNLVLRVSVQGGCSLVEQEELWFADESASDCDALLLTTG